MTRARRPNLYVINALTKRYAKAKGQLGREAVKADLAHLGAVLFIFDPGIDLAAIPPTRPYKAARGRWNRTAMEVLRKSNRPLKAFELARLVMSQQGVEPDRRTLKSIGYSLQAVLTRLQAQGLVVATGKPRRWAIAR